MNNLINNIRFWRTAAQPTPNATLTPTAAGRDNADALAPPQPAICPQPVPEAPRVAPTAPSSSRARYKTIRMHGHIIDPAAIPASNNPNGSHYILLQGTGERLATADKRQLVDCGVDIHEYVGSNSYLCGYTNGDLTPLRALPFVQWVDVYPTSVKVSNDLQADNAPKPKVAIVFHDGVDEKSVAPATAAAVHEDVSKMYVGSHKVCVTMDKQYLDAVAAIDGVRVIEKVYPIVLY